MKSVWKKCIAILSLGGVLGSMALFDWVRSSTYEVAFLSAVRQGDKPLYDETGALIPKDVGITDGATKVDFTLRVSKGGKGVPNHVLYIRTNRGTVGRIPSDAEGYVRFTYDCYYATVAKDVVFTANDEDNSIFVSIPATGSYTLKMVASSSGEGGGLTTNDIFHDLEEGGAA